MNKGLLFSLVVFGSCSLFTDYPEPIQAAQRNTYAGLQLLESNYNDTADYWMSQQLKIITYYENYIAELRIGNGGDKAAIEAELNTKLKSYKDKLTQTLEEQKSKSKKNFILVKQLAEAVYNYISTTPISLDNIDFLIDQAKELIKK